MMFSAYKMMKNLIWNFKDATIYILLRVGNTVLAIATLAYLVYLANIVS